MVSGKKGIYEENGGVNVKRIVCIGVSNTDIKFVTRNTDTGNLKGIED